MKALRKYVLKMTNTRYIYCGTLLELMRRGYSRRQARKLISHAKLVEQAADKEYGWMMFHDMEEKEWADLAEKIWNGSSETERLTA